MAQPNLVWFRACEKHAGKWNLECNYKAALREKNTKRKYSECSYPSEAEAATCEAQRKFLLELQPKQRNGEPSMERGFVVFDHQGQTKAVKIYAMTTGVLPAVQSGKARDLRRALEQTTTPKARKKQRTDGQPAPIKSKQKHYTREELVNKQTEEQEAKTQIAQLTAVIHAGSLTGVVSNEDDDSDTAPVRLRDLSSADQRDVVSKSAALLLYLQLVHMTTDTASLLVSIAAVNFLALPPKLYPHQTSQP